MRYIKTVDLWTEGGERLARQGRLQCGQWVRCGDSPPSRWVGIRGYSMWVTHHNGQSVSLAKFQSMCRAIRG